MVATTGGFSVPSLRFATASVLCDGELDQRRLWYDDDVRTFEKRRERAAEGSIPDVLDMFASEVHFYREVAPVVGVRVPKCFAADSSPNGTRLVLEDL